jgi:tetratricopeptide (TPR) repeat protein/transcriptional regulator with XRE-family HTH domain
VAGQPASSFALLLGQLRAEAGLTQEELAQAAGLGLRTVSDLERGAHRTAHQDTARLLADGLGLPEPVRGLFVAAARGRVPADQVFAARDEALAALLAVAIPSPAPAAAPVPRELPADIGAFTGRTIELAELDLLLPASPDGGAGQVTGPVVISAVSGTAGVGKTALAIRWAHRVRDAFPDGQLYVNLRGYDPDQPLTPGEALARFLRALGVADQDIPLEDEERAARYRSVVAGRRLLVVLDNAATEEQVRPLLPGSPPVMVVVTSRGSLSGLVARDGAHRLDLDLLPAGEAVALLRALIGERAGTDPQATEALAELCARLPLALRVAAELAASRPDTPVSELAAELAGEEDRLALLDAGGDPRSAVAGVFSWSYRHLPAAARMFRLLGLHPAQDWDPYAAAALTATGSLTQARQLLGVLARAHLIQPAGAGRYQMHDLLRAYAARQATTHDTDQARQDALTRLFDYYLAASNAATGRLGPFQFTPRPAPPSVGTPVPQFQDRAAAVAWLDTERATLLAVAAHTASHGWPSHTTRLAATLHGYLYEEHEADGLTMHGLALEAARRLGDRAAEARALAGLGNSHYYQGRLQQSADMCQQALALAREVGDRIAQANALVHLSMICEAQARVQQSFDFGWQAIALYPELGNRAGEATQLANQGHNYFFQGQWQEGIEYIQQALTLGREIDDRRSIAYSLAYLGETYYYLSRCQQAAEHAREALAVTRRSGPRSFEARALMQLADICHRQGRHVLAAGYSQQALEIYQELGERASEADALNVSGDTLLATGHPDKARACHASALAIAREAKYVSAHARSLIGVAEVSRWHGNHVEAHGYYQQALQLVREKGELCAQAEALNGVGEVLLAMARHREARTCVTEALSLAERTGYRGLSIFRLCRTSGGSRSH